MTAEVLNVIRDEILSILDKSAGHGPHAFPVEIGNRTTTPKE